MTRIPRAQLERGDWAREHLHPDLVAELETWRDDEDLRGLVAALDAHTELKAFLDTAAEAMIARRLRQAGCSLRFEVPTPRGRRCDFEVERDGVRFFLHLKRMEIGRPVNRRLSISSRLRYLERLDRPYVVSLRWLPGLDDTEMQHLVIAASEFIMKGRIGEESLIRNDDGREIGGVQIVAPSRDDKLHLTIGLPSGFIDEVPRMRRLFRRAYRQFMPREANVIMVSSSHVDDRDDCETALLGAHVERWDRHPPRGRRIAHGRAADGFWHGGGFVSSRIAGWYRFAPDQPDLDATLWIRDGQPVPDELRSLTQELFGAAGD